MSGHSKWANIKHKKGKADAERGKVFTKIGREIAIAVRDGGSDPAINGKLRDVIAKAKASNMPNENIKRSIAKAAGELGNVNYEEIQYEGYAPGGVAVIVSTVTDNRNRTASDIRHIFDKNGGSLGTNGCVSYMFDNVGMIVIERKPGMDEDEVIWRHWMPARPMWKRWRIALKSRLRFLISLPFVTISKKRAILSSALN